MSRALGRRRPTDLRHIERYPFADVAPPTVPVVNQTLTLPTWHWEWDQGSEGACVGYGTSMMMTLLNRRRYDPAWLYHEAQKADEWPGEDYEGTSVRAACRVLVDQGHVRVYAGLDRPVSLVEGISSYRWATTVDQIRTAISMGMPLSFGIDWYTRFDNPTGAWMARDGDALDSIRGGHCVCIYGASDRYQAVRIKNSWGRAYPLVWCAYSVVQRLLDQWGEAALVADRVA